MHVSLKPYALRGKRRSYRWYCAPKRPFHPSQTFAGEATLGRSNVCVNEMMLHARSRRTNLLHSGRRSAAGRSCAVHYCWLTERRAQHRGGIGGAVGHGA